jgi:hypothetical protein
VDFIRPPPQSYDGMVERNRKGQVAQEGNSLCFDVFSAPYEEYANPFVIELRDVLFNRQQACESG